MARDFLTKKIVFIFLLVSILGVKNADAQTLTITENINISATVGGTSTPGGGGSSGSIVIPSTSVRFSGVAYPSAKVVLLKEGIEMTSVTSDESGNFSITLPEDYNRNVLYSLYATDVLGNRSVLINYPIVVYIGYLTHLSGIRFSPTIVLNKSEVRSGDYLTVSGYVVPEANLETILDGGERKVFTMASSKSGLYTITVPMSGLAKGDYVVHTKYENDTRISKLVRFSISDINIPILPNNQPTPGDCNVDRKINIVDFSILAFWYGKKNPPNCVDTNKDKIINLADFSILAFYWTR